MGNFTYVKEFDARRYIGYASLSLGLLIVGFFIMQLLHSRVFYPNQVSTALVGCSTENAGNPLSSSCGYFLHNIGIALIAWLGGLAIIGPFYIIWENSMNIGMYLATAVTNPSQLQHDSTIEAIAFLLPHGVFEIPAIILSIAMGIYLVDMMLEKRRKAPNYKIAPALVQTLPYAIVALGLFGIAAFIEANISPGFAESVGEVLS